MILLDDFVGDVMKNELDPFVDGTAFDAGSLQVSDDSADASDDVFLSNLWVESSRPSNTIFDDFPQDTSALKPMATADDDEKQMAIKPEPPATARASFASFAKVKKEQAKYAKRDPATVGTAARRAGATADALKPPARRTKKGQAASSVYAAPAPPPQQRPVPRGRRKTNGDDVDSKLRDMEEQLKNLDPNSKEAKKQRRLIRNRMSAQLHRERKKMYVDQLEGELYHRDLEISRLKGELASLREVNTRLKRDLQAKNKSAALADHHHDDLLPSDVLEDCLFADLELPEPSSPELMTDVEGDCGDMTPRSSATLDSSDIFVTTTTAAATKTKNVTVLLAVAFSVAFFGNNTQLLDELALGRDLGAFFKTKLQTEKLPTLSVSRQSLVSLKDTIWEREAAVAEEDNDDEEQHRSKRQRLDPRVVRILPGARAAGTVHDNDDDVEQYSPEVLKYCAAEIVQDCTQDLRQSIIGTLQALLPRGNRVSSLKFLFPSDDPDSSSRNSYEQINCQVIEA